MNEDGQDDENDARLLGGELSNEKKLERPGKGGPLNLISDFDSAHTSRLFQIIHLIRYLSFLVYDRFMTKYERARVLGSRAMQIRCVKYTEI